LEDLVTIATFDFTAQANVVKLILEKRGIKVFLADDNLVGMDWFVSNAVGGVKLQVAASDANRAGKIIKKRHASKKKLLDKLPKEDVTFTCEDCGSKITFPAERRGGVETCPNCNSFVDVPYNNEATIVANSISTTSKPDTSSPAEIKHIEMSSVDSLTNRQLWLEVFAVLSLCLIPGIYTAITSLIIPHPNRATEAHSIDTQFLSLIHSLQMVFPLLVIVVLSRESWRNFGIIRPRCGVDIIGGCAVWACVKSVSIVVHCILPASMFEHDIISHPKPGGIFHYLLLLMAICASVFAQELAVRGFLLTRLERLLKSTTGAIVISTILFGSYHVYQGLGSAISVTAAGLVYAIAFCMFRRLWPICISHAITNILFYIQ
jgi:membrane protease YdiL (CAAX protease family)